MIARLAVAFVLCVAASIAIAQIPTSASNSETVPGCEPRFVKLPALAKRLGVPPLAPGFVAKGDVLVEMCDGTTYDIIDIAEALLDRLAAKYPHIGK